MLRTSVILLIFLMICSCKAIVYQSSGLFSRNSSNAKDMLDAVNEARAQGRMCGNKYYEPAEPLVWNHKLGIASLNHSKDMAENSFLSHKGSDGSTLSERLVSVNYSWIKSGENIGHGYQSSEDAINSWLKSKIHCENIMNPEFKELGASYAKSESRRTYWTMVLAAPLE